MKTTVQKNLTLMIGLSVGSVLVLSGCNQHLKKDTITLASKHQAQAVFNNQASRNTGAWGGVYMSRDELNAPDSNIVDVRSVPSIKADPNLTKWQAKFEGKDAFVTTNGKKLYHDSCAGCHMHDGTGAKGAGYYPPLANNSKMQSKYYIIDILINGFRGMPSFHSMMNDVQIAAVTQYVHSELNEFTDTVTAADVASLRHENPPGADPSE